jgi:hypothetical protein
LRKNYYPLQPKLWRRHEIFIATLARAAKSVGNKPSEESGFGEKNMLIHTLIKAVKDETLTKIGG